MKKRDRSSATLASRPWLRLVPVLLAKALATAVDVHAYIGGMADCGSCYSDDGSGTWVHHMGNCTGGPWYAAPEGCHSQEYLGVCSQWHYGGCAIGGPSPEDMAAASVNAQRLRELIAAYPARVVVDGARKAIQLIDCSGAVAAHVTMAASNLARAH